MLEAVCSFLNFADVSTSPYMVNVTMETHLWPLVTMAAQFTRQHQKPYEAETKGTPHLVIDPEGIEVQQETVSLQEAFLKFRKKKQDELRERLAYERRSSEQRMNPQNMEQLRKKVLDTALEYIGVPYAQRYHSPESPTYHSDLFLDCCGLVRRVVRDLKEDFGFTIGPWNQAYQFDTLPISLSGPEAMKPGDLVFISAVYYNPKAKKQRHDMVHVEIWMGDGEKTLGARWQKGNVEIHESYKFVSKSYHSMKFHFHSIDTWLAGECKSHCDQHAWLLKSFHPDKRSIFALEEDEHCDAYSEEEEEDDRQHHLSQREQDKSEESQCLPSQPEDKCNQSQVRGEVANVMDACGSKEGVQGSKAMPPAKTTPTTKSSSSRRVRPPGTFVICGGNAAPLVDQHLTSQGWLKLEDKTSLNFTLKWVEIRQHVDFKNFKEGEQLVNRFPNIQLLTTKIGLLENLRSYCRLHKQRLESFVPETYRLDVASDKEEFLKSYKEGELWICKPTGANQGKGIFLVRELQELLDKLEADKKCCKPSSRPTARIIQRYINEPLLLKGRKFDIRVYMLVLAGSPWVVLYRHGYVRLCCESYQLSSPNLSVHLTNQYQQKKTAVYQEVKEDTVWDFDKFQECLTNDHGLPRDWVRGHLTRRIISLMTTCFNSIKHKLVHGHGYFDLLGFDFMLDREFNVWLIEVNVNPAMHTNCVTLAAICPAVVQETLDIAIEVFGKCRRNKSPQPLSAAKQFRTIIPRC